MEEGAAGASQTLEKVRRGSVAVAFREARPEDAGGIARVHIETWRAAYRGIVPDAYLDGMDYDQRKARWQEALTRPVPSVFTLVAVSEEGEIIGWATGCNERDGDPLYTGELGGIYVLPEAQRGGVGRSLVSGVVKRLTEQGHSAMLVWTLEQNPARLFYEKLGGRYLRSKPYEVAGAALTQVAYGWLDLRPLILSECKG